MPAVMIDRGFATRADPSRQEQWLEQKQRAKQTLASRIRKEYIPQLETELRAALAGTVARFSIEQMFLEFRWRPARTRVRDIRDDVVVTAFPPDVLRAFGVYDASEQLSWGEMKAALASNAAGIAPFFVGAVENAIGSALAATPTDNDQLVLASDGRVNRVIVTRHYAYFDGGRTMHVYFIPLLADPFDEPAARSVVLLRLATRFRLMFLDAGAPLSPQGFALSQLNPAAFLDKIEQFERETLFVAGQSHNHSLDDPRSFLEFLPEAARPAAGAVAHLFADWQRESRAILALAAQARRHRSDVAAFSSRWDEALRRYIAFVEPVNRHMGTVAAEHLLGWFRVPPPQ